MASVWASIKARLNPLKPVKGEADAATTQSDAVWSRLVRTGKVGSGTARRLRPIRN